MDLFYVLLILLVLTRAFGELAVRTGQPSLVGELVTDVVLGAVIALKNGIFSIPGITSPVLENLFSAIVVMAIITTVVTPVMLEMIYGKPSDPSADRPKLP